jgi:hydrogenase nickel incorporation protein HypB
MFRAACLVLLNKIDLLPHLDFDMTQAVVHVRMVNAAAAVLPVSARTGEGLTRWYDWLRQQLAAAREAAFA